jgi:hypothetical protein
MAPSANDRSVDASGQRSLLIRNPRTTGFSAEGTVGREYSCARTNGTSPNEIIRIRRDLIAITARIVL